MDFEDTAVAVTGMALRAPGADTPDEFWANLLAGRDCLTRATETGLRRAGVPERLIRDESFVRSRPVLRAPGEFDPAFFNLSGVAAKTMDPCHRLFMTCAWEALERAGVAPGPEAGVVGVFGGGGGGQDGYIFRNFGGGVVDLNDPAVWLPINVGGNPEHITGRVSFHLDLRGPNVSSLAACATSLVSIHLAVRSLQHHECDLALAGGASVATPHWPAYGAAEGGPVSPSGTVRAFDARADGTVFGSGVGVVVLRRLQEAVEAGDHIHAVILGTGIYNDGGGKKSFAAPAMAGQVAAITRALDSANVSADTVEFLESHGTGTLVGDPLEVQATAQVYRRDTDRKQYCALGAVKSNIGHAASAAGVLALIKTCMALEHGIIPPNIHCETPNPDLDLPETPFYLPTTAKRWRRNGHPRRAGVSAFGFGGNNAHVVMEGPPPVPSRPIASGPESIMLSARTETALDRQVERLSDHLEAHPELDLKDVAHTLRIGRKQFDHRAAVVVSDVSEAGRRLAKREIHHGLAHSDRVVIFAFPGQGSQYGGMGRQLYEEDPVYRLEVDTCAELLSPQLGLDIRSFLNSDKDDNGRLQRTSLAQPALFVAEYALASRLMSCGIRPQAIIGHSIGELVAACLAGVFSLSDALRLVTLRGRLMQACEPGAMLTVFLSSTDLEERLEEGVEIAAFNAPEITTVSGSTADIERMSKRFADEGVGYRLLHTSHGFHSQSMKPAVEPFARAVASVQRAIPSVSFVSNVTGRLITEQQALDPNYWGRQIREPVRFTQGIEALSESGSDDAVWIEVGPGGALSNLVRRQASSRATVIATWDGDERGHAGFLDVLSRLWIEGIPLAEGAFGGGRRSRKVILPTYPFETQNYWLDPPLFQPDQTSRSSVADTDPRRVTGDEAKQWLHVPRWREEALRKPQLAVGQGWLVFERERSFDSRVTERLRALGAQVLSVRPGERFEEIGPNLFAVRPGDATDLAAVLEEGRNASWVPSRVLHLWTLGQGDHDNEDPVVRFRDSLVAGFDSLAALMQALQEGGVEREVSVTVATDGVAVLEGEDGPEHWEKASLLGPCRVVPKEMPTVSCQLIDIPAPESPANWLDDALLAEASSPEPEVLKVLREKGRFIEMFEALDENVSGGTIRPGGVVFITGGTGGLGLEVAARLHDVAKMRLALLTRWNLPPEDQWPSRALISDRVGRALRKILAMREQGAEVLIVQGDATLADEMARAVERVRAHFGVIHGVVHAAGTIDPRLVLDAARHRCDEVFDAKIKAALILEELLGDDPLDFFISFSSVSSVAPRPGQVDYSAANAVLDALARRRSSSHWRRVASISWDAWQEVGMAAEAVRTTSFDLPDLLAGPPGETVEHPLWEYCRRDKDRVLFSTVLTPAEHWVTDEHRLDGVAVLPATGIVEMVRAAHCHLRGSERPTSIRDVVFRQFVKVPDAGLEVWLAFRDVGQETQFEVRSCVPREGEHRFDDLDLHTTGTISSLKGLVPTAHVARGETQLCDQRRGRLDKGPHFRRITIRENTDDKSVVEFSMPEEYQSEAAAYGLHPALLDTVLGQLASRRIDVHSVPATIADLRVYRRMPATVTTVVDDVQTAAGMVSVVIADEHGNVVAEVDDFQLVPLSRNTEGDEPTERRLTIHDPGDLATCELVQFDLSPPAPGEVQIEVYAAGLNFRDVLSAVGGLSESESSTALRGGECSGRIVAVGSGVEGFSAGDAVMAMDRGAFASRMNADARLVAHKPPNLGFEEAAAAPIAYLTAEYALNHLGRLQPGERVLIHAAAGGVGLAAIQVARAAGAEIYATAGSEEKRAFLRELGVEYVMDSRSLDFVQEIHGYTDGAGVDLVLNSLAGEFIPAGLEVLGPFGRFLEIGKRDIYENAKIGLLPFRNNLSLHAIDLGPMIQAKNPVLIRMFGELVEALGSQRLKPGPILTVPWQDAKKAMEHMAAARHIGKIVLRMRRATGGSKGLDGKEAPNLEGGGSIALQHGLDIFQELLQRTDLPPHVVVSTRSLGGGSARGTQAPALRDHGAASRQRTSLVAYRAPSNRAEETIVEVWRQVLSVETVGADDSFIEMGGDSIASILVLNRIRKAFGCEVPPNALFDYPTPALLADALESHTVAS